ncbi:PP2C family serine/threonine-protein phosphatase [Streptomyces sp. G1]|uniref:PP2C family protein-serine/threonine phosphatase n=1 Tax=Streptomyces sp. G1 TaxID=361572 RepID=UPI00202EE1F9|nr:PP2C family serine/threonine-protein phosphatase [Streptomyces sp. G1]MCM1964865.1 protein phosphatase 2C family protein [Streptomyces sp. G1]
MTDAPYAVSRLIGGRTHQCDATAAAVDPYTGARAYAVLDGIGSSYDVAQFAQFAGLRLTSEAVASGDPYAVLSGLRDELAEEPLLGTGGERLYACAVLAVHVPGQPLRVAWCGDSRAYHLNPSGILTRLTVDHNMRQVHEDRGSYASPASRHHVTSCLGSKDTVPAAGHRPLVGSAEVPAPRGRLLLVTDGGYEPLEDNGAQLGNYLTGTPAEAAQDLTETAVSWAGMRSDNATALVADIP